MAQIFGDDAASRPERATINTGFFGRSTSFVPLEGIRREGDDLQIPWEQAQVKAAPQVDERRWPSHARRGSELYRHYAKEQRLAPDADDVGRKETPDGNGGTERGRDEDEARPGFPVTGQARQEIRRDRKGATRIAGPIGMTRRSTKPGAIERSLVEP